MERQLNALHGKPLRLVDAGCPEGTMTAALRRGSSESDTGRELGKLGRAVMREIADIPRALSDHPGLVECALSLADQVDGNTQPALMVSAAKEIKLLLAEMRPAPAANLTDVGGQTAQDKLIERLAAAL
jgi:hypothetical protein